MWVEDARLSWVTRQAVLLLGFLLTSGACARRGQDTPGAVGGLDDSGAVVAAADLASEMTKPTLPTKEPSRVLPVSKALEAAGGRNALAPGAAGTSFVSASQEHEVYVLVDDDGDHRVDRVRAVKRGLNAFNWSRQDAASYDAELSRALGIDAFKGRLDRSPRTVVVVTDNLSARQRQGWRYVRFAGGWLYIPVRVAHQA